MSDSPVNRKQRRKSRGAKRSGKLKRVRYTNVAIPKHEQPWRKKEVNHG